MRADFMDAQVAIPSRQRDGDVDVGRERAEHRGGRAPAEPALVGERRDHGAADDDVRQRIHLLAALRSRKAPLA